MAPLQVLVVDDSAVIRSLLEARLQVRGYEVVSVASGEAALSYLEHSVPDLVFLDLLMPGMDGLEVLGQLQSRKLDLAVITMTALESEEMVLEARRRGAADSLPKPFEARDLDRVLQRAVAQLSVTETQPGSQEASK